MFGIEINYKDGKKDWIDPVYDEPIELDGFLIVSNTIASYEYALSDIEKWFKYDLCKKCEYDSRSYDCTNDACLNPRYA